MLTLRLPAAGEAWRSASSEERMSGYKINSGKNVKRQWGIPGVQVRYHKDGTWFMPLERFPGALCDPDGYIIFQNE